MKRDVLILTAVVLAGGWLRFHSLDAKSLWYDEAVSAATLDFSLPEIAGRKGDPASVHPPLYFFLLYAWAHLFGDSVFALRSLAAVCGVCTVIGVYFFTRALCALSGDTRFSGRVGLWAAALTAVHPLHIVSSQQVRGYSLATALLAWSSWLLVCALLVKGRRTGVFWAGWAILAVLLCYVSNLAVLSVAAQGLFAAICLSTRYYCAWRVGSPSGSSPRGVLSRLARRDRTRSSSGPEDRQLRWAVIAGAILLLGYGLPWSSRLLSQAETVRTTTAIVRPLTLTSIPQELHRSFDASWAAHKSRSRLQIYMTTGLLATLFLFLAVRGGWGGLYLLLTGLLPIVLVILFSAFSNRSIVVARYFTFAQLMWLAALAYVVFRSAFRAEQALLGAVIVGNCAFLLSMNWESIGPSHQPGMRSAVHYALQRRDTDERLVARERHSFFGVKYYSRDRAAPLLLTDITDRSLLRGGYEMRDRDLITPDGLLSLDIGGVWMFTTDAYNTPQRADFETPEGWELADSRVFEQDFFWEGPIEVCHFRFAAQGRRHHAPEGPVGN